ncbi:MAG: HNH endonuclease [Candidatus Eiseniibacteriota bacterium]
MFHRRSSSRPTTIVIRLPPRWRHSRNELSGETGAVQLVVRPRLGQGGFRVAVADVYGRMCAVSTEHSLPALEAAHIRPYAEGGNHELRNGLLLRADIHRLFDKGFVTVTPDFQFRVSRRLEQEYENGRIYYELEARVRSTGGIHLPQDPAARPGTDLLEWHSSERFVA